MEYGIPRREPPCMADAVRCLDYAVHNGVRTIDTAAAYGCAEEVVGTFLQSKSVPREQLILSTKMMPNLLDDLPPDETAAVIRRELEQSLKRLHTEYVDIYLLHSARYAFRPDILQALSGLTATGLARRVGVSVYEPEEARRCFASGCTDVVQLPFSIFDHRMKTAGIFDPSVRQRCEIHARSAFIQGLVCLQEDQLPPGLQRARPILRRMDRICAETGLSRVALALAFVKKEPAVSRLVFGVNTLDQLREDITLFNRDYPDRLLAEIEKEFDGIAADIVMPSLWKLNHTQENTEQCEN